LIVDISASTEAFLETINQSINQFI